MGLALSALAWGPVALSIGGALIYVLFILGYSIGNALRRRLWMGAVLLCVAGYGGWKLGVGVPIYWVWQAVLIIGCIALLAGMFGEPLGP